MLKGFARGALCFAVFIGVVLAIVLAAALANSYSGASFRDKVREYVFYAGIILILAGGLGGVGLSEAAYYRSSMFTLSSRYQNAIMKDRMERRRQQFAFMLFTVAAGAVLVILPWLI
ncbi:MAG: hypothetical protein AB1665_06590 [Candidatus Thermoplasmatota archaeon]